MPVDFLERIRRPQRRSRREGRDTHFRCGINLTDVDVAASEGNKKWMARDSVKMPTHLGFCLCCVLCCGGH